MTKQLDWAALQREAARRFGVRKTQVSIRSGATARTKLIEVDG